MQRAFRLTNRASFTYIRRNGKALVCPILVIGFVKAYNIKVGISVSKKIGNSVVRSLVKRRIREAFRLLLPELKGTYNYVVTAREPIAGCDYHTIDRALRKLLTGAGHLDAPDCSRQ